MDTHPRSQACNHTERESPAVEPTVVTTVLGSDTRNAAHARHLLRSALGRCGLAELTADAELALSEIVANVWRHTRAEIVPIAIRCDTDTVEVCVANTVGGGPSRTPAGARRETGREGGFGLRIVELVTESCGWLHTPAGDAHQFTVARRNRPGPAAN